MATEKDTDDNSGGKQNDSAEQSIEEKNKQGTDAQNVVVGIEPDECLVCWESKPDTIVLPCMHSVVCRACSDRLKTTADRDTCVRCRRPIEIVLCDET